MLRRTVIAGILAGAASFAGVWFAKAEDRPQRSRIQVDHYNIDADINPRTQTLSANVQVHFTPLEDGVSTATFELNNALNVSRVTAAGGEQIPTSRSADDFTVRLNFPQPLPKGQAATVTFAYDGRLTGAEDSPVYGVKFAAIHPDYAYLLYPARWFPISGYTTDRFTADTKITVPAGYTVLASGLGDSDRSAGDKTTFVFHYNHASFPGSIAVVQGQPQRVTESGVVTDVYFRSRANMAQAYGQETGKVMTYLTSLYGLPPQANLTLVETEDGSAAGYSAPGLLFLSPKTIGTQVSARQLVNQAARQWWGALVSPVTRDHLWLQNGNARYAEILYTEHTDGPGAASEQLRDTYVEALTVDNPPVIQAARLDDYSPEYWAETASKGAAVLSMLRSVMGDQGFFKLMKGFPEEYSWKPVNTQEFRKAAEMISGRNLQPFFLQWLESTGAPTFKLEYTIFRTQKGFRVMGKITQDLDTFQMPVDLRIETEGNPEDKRVEVSGPSSEFTVDTFGKPKNVILDPQSKVLHFDPSIRVAVAIKRGEQFAQVGEYGDALKEYQKALDVAHNSSLAHYRVAEIFLFQNNYQSAANEFRESLNGDLDPKWTEVWAHIKLGNIFDITGQRDRAVNEYNHALRTRDNTAGAQEQAAKFLKQPYERKSNV